VRLAIRDHAEYTVLISKGSYCRRVRLTLLRFLPFYENLPVLVNLLDIYAHFVSISYTFLFTR